MERKTTKKATAKVRNTPVSNVQSISPKTPIPFEGGKGFSYVANSEYLPFLGGDDNYGRLLLESRLLSAAHNACVTTKKDYCAGSGFRHLDDTPINKKMAAWLKSMNIKDESATELSRQSFENNFTFGNCPIELCRFSVGSKKYFYVYVHNFLEWKLGVPDPDDDVVKYAIQSKLFLNNGFVLTSEQIKNSRKLPIYNPRYRDTAKSKVTPGYNWVRDANGTERTLIWYKHSVSGFSYYGLPSAVSGLIYQKLEYKGARYNLDNFDNDMVISAILALKGNISQPEADRIGKKAVTTHTGDGKRGRVMVVASEEGIDSSDFHSFDTHKDGSYVESDSIWTQKIVLANQWDSVLAGILSQSTLGKGSGFITKILEIKKNTVIRPAQRDLMDKVWSKVFTLANKWLDLGIDPYDFEIEDTIDISGLTDVDITPAVTVDEVRGAKSLPKLTDKKKGNMLLGELGAEQKKGVYVKDTRGSKKKKEDESV